VTLPDDVAYALSDGVVLCHFINQIRARAVQSIHVPSQAVVRIEILISNKYHSTIFSFSQNYHWRNVEEMWRISLKQVVVLVYQR
jgi:hypothetical protein